MTSEPDFMVCLDCETPCYTFEWSDQNSRVIEAFCQTCGNDDVEHFNSEDEYMGEE